MNISIIGTGYVGLITGLSFSHLGNKVTCVDVNPNVVESLNKGIPTFYEKGLESLLKRELNQKRFHVTTILENAIKDADIIFIAVGTPSKKNGDINLSYIEEVSINIGKQISHLDRYISIVIKSTVLPKTTDTHVRELIEKYSGKKTGEFGLGMNPEFLREGTAINDFMFPDRIIIGFEDERTKRLLLKIYESWHCEKIIVNTRTAELIKYTNNCFLAILVSATNEIANISTSIGNIDFSEVMSGVKLDKRWNPLQNNQRINPEILHYLNPGCGFGGSCLPKDINALVNLGSREGREMKILKSVLDVNFNQPYQIIIDLMRFANLKNKKILVLGLSFKPGTDDVRESSSVRIIKELIKKRVDVSAHDPVAINNFKKENQDLKHVNYVTDWESASKNVDIIIVLTAWDIYKRIHNINLQNQVIYDARGILNRQDLLCKKYISFGFSN